MGETVADTSVLFDMNKKEFYEKVHVFIVFREMGKSRN